MTAICRDPFCQLPNDGHRHEGLRDLAHSYADEVYVQPSYNFYRMSKRDHLVNGVQCVAYAMAVIVGAFVIWGLLVALLLGVPA